MAACYFFLRAVFFAFFAAFFFLAMALAPCKGPSRVTRAGLYQTGIYTSPRGESTQFIDILIVRLHLIL